MQNGQAEGEIWHCENGNTDTALPDNKELVVAKHQAVLEEEMEFPLGDPVDQIRFMSFN